MANQTDNFVVTTAVHVQYNICFWDLFVLNNVYFTDFVRLISNDEINR